MADLDCPEPRCCGWFSTEQAGRTLREDHRSKSPSIATQGTPETRQDEPAAGCLTKSHAR